MNMLRLTPLLAAVAILATTTGCSNQLSRDHGRLAAYHEYRQGNYDDARERFERVLDADPTDWRSHYYVGRIALEHDANPELARRHLDIAHTVHASRASSRVHYTIADPNTGVPYPTRAQILDSYAEAIYQTGDEDRLYAFLQQTAENYGETEDYMRIGEYMQRLGDHDAARSAYRTAVRRGRGRDPEPHFRLADFYEELGNRDNAAIELRKVYGIDPEHPDIGRRLREHNIIPSEAAALPHDWEEEG